MPRKAASDVLTTVLILQWRGYLPSAEGTCSQDTPATCWAMPSGVSIGCPSEQGEAFCFPKTGNSHLRVATRGNCRCASGWCALPPSNSTANVWSCATAANISILNQEHQQPQRASTTRDQTSSTTITTILLYSPFTASLTSTTTTYTYPVHSLWHAEPQWREFDGHTYILVDELATWDDQRIRCESLASHMVTISSQTEHEFVVSLMPPPDSVSRWSWLWIGMTRVLLNSWVDGSPTNYTHWAPGQPSATTDDDGCGAIFRPTGDNWHKRSCSGKSRTVCERDALFYYLIPQERQDTAVGRTMETTGIPTTVTTTTEHNLVFSRVIDMSREVFDEPFQLRSLEGQWPAVCDNACGFFSNNASTCKEAIQFNYFNRYTGDEYACELAERVVHENCPDCVQCQVSATGCKDNPWRYMQPTTAYPQTSTSLQQLYSERGFRKQSFISRASIGAFLLLSLFIVTVPMFGVAYYRRRRFMFPSAHANAGQPRLTREWNPSRRSKWALSFDALVSVPRSGLVPEVLCDNSDAVDGEEEALL